MCPPDDLSLDELRRLQILDVLRCGVQRHIERRRELAHAALALGKLPKHVTTRAVRERRENGVQTACIISVAMLNHLVEYQLMQCACQAASLLSAGLRQWASGGD